jgi:GTP1/Obg family GTP-binding protein
MSKFACPHLQVTDTPGVLYRPDEDRNAMEMLTIATLEHLPTAALFVFDLTEDCGCDVQQQWYIRRELQCRFPHKLWIDVITKADVLEEELDQAACLGEQEIPEPEAVPADAIQIVCPSHKTGKGAAFWHTTD